jgi:hypothetical protein
MLYIRMLKSVNPQTWISDFQFWNPKSWFIVFLDNPDLILITNTRYIITISL